MPCTKFAAAAAAATWSFSLAAVNNLVDVAVGTGMTTLCCGQPLLASRGAEGSMLLEEVQLVVHERGVFHELLLLGL